MGQKLSKDKTCSLNNYAAYLNEAIEMGIKNPLTYKEWKEFEDGESKNIRES